MHKLLSIVISVCLLGKTSWSQNDSIFIDSLKNQLLITSLNNYEKAELLSKISSNYFKLKQYPLSIEYNNQALIKYVELNDLTNQAICNLQIGQTYTAINNYTKTLDYYLKALNISEKSSNDSLTFIINQNIGTFYLSIDNIENAMTHLLISESFFIKHPKKFNSEIVKNYRFKGIAYGKTNQLDSSLYCFNKALSYLNDDTPSHQIEKGGLLNNIGAIHLKKNQFDVAINNFSLALEIFKKINNMRGIGISTFNIALSNKKQQKYKQAISLFEVANTHFISTNDLISSRECYNNLSNIYDILGDYENAFKYYQKYTAIKDSIMSVDVVTNISNIETQYKINKIEEENEIRIQLIENQRKLNNYRWYFVSGILIIFLLIITTLLFRHKSKQKLTEAILENSRLEKVNLEQEKQHLKEELNFKTNELANFANYILNRNEILEKIKDEIKNIRRSSDKNTDKLQRLVNQSLSFDKDRKEFLIKVEQSHKSFFFKLQNKFPDLTDNEKRILALVMAELSSKEIASLLNISLGSVDMARYRLRKKLNIDSNQSIIDFLTSL